MATSTTMFEQELLGGIPNSVLNPSAETDASSQTPFAPNTVTRSSEQAETGGFSFKCTWITGGPALFTWWGLDPSAFPNANEYVVAQARVWIPANWDGGQITIGDEGQITGTAIGSRLANMSQRDQWQTIWFVKQNNADSLDDWILFIGYLTTPPTTGRSIYVDSVLAQNYGPVNPVNNMPLAANYSGSDRGLMAGAAYRLRQYYQAGQSDPLAHTLAKFNPRQVEALTRNNKLASFDAILGA